MIQNLPHKVFVYAALMGLVASENPEICNKLVCQVLKDLISTSLFKEQDAFSSRNTFKWLAYLVYLRAVSPEAALGFLCHVLQEQKNNENTFQRDVVLDCVFTFLLCEDARLQVAGCAEYSNFTNQLSQLMSSRQEFESVFRKLMGLPETSLDSIAAKWKLLSHKPSEGSSFPLDQVYMMVGKEKQQQVIEALRAKPASVQ